MIGIGLSADNAYHTAVKRPEMVLKFDGLNDFASLSAPSTKVTDTATIELTFKAESKGDLGTQHAMIVDKYGTGYGYAFFLKQDIWTLCFRYGTKMVDDIGGMVMTDGQIHTAKAVVTPTSLDIFIDGVNKYSEALSSPLNANPSGTVTDTVYIGMRSGSQFPFKGEVRNLSISNGAVKVLDYKFNEGAGSVIRDSSAYKTDATINGATWIKKVQ